MKDFEQDDFGAGAAGGGATGIFGTLAHPVRAAEKTQDPVPEDPFREPRPAEQVPFLHGVAFQAADDANRGDADPLRRMIEARQTPAGTPPGSSPAGSFTQLFSTMSAQPHSSLSAAESDAEPAAMPVPAASMETAVGSFTQLFRTLDQPTRTPQSTVDFVSPAALVDTPAAHDSPTPSLSAQISQLQISGGISGLPQAFEAGAPAAAEPMASLPRGASPLNVEAVATGGVAGPGSISAIPPASAEPSLAANSFTKMFQAFEPKSRLQQEQGSRAAVAPPSTAPGSSAVGSFTQLFSTIATRPVATSQADSFPPLPPADPFTPPITKAFPGTEMGRPATVYPAASIPEPSFGEASGLSTQQTSQMPAMSNAGSLTQLLRTLDAPSSAPTSSTPRNDTQPSTWSAPPAPDVPRSAPTPTGIGATPFSAPSSSTTLDNATVAFRMPQPGIPAASATPAPSSLGQGEFTRILNASALRESLRRGGQPAAAAASPAPGSGAPAAAGFPAIPAYPVAPQLPQIPQIPHAGAAYPMPPTQAAPAQPMNMSPLQMAHMQMPPVQTPQMQLPAAPATAVPTVGDAGKSWLPILLIVIIVLLVAILLAVVLLMKK